MYFRKAAWLSAAVGMSAVGGAWAQDVRTIQAAHEAAGAVEEVVVTARRREESLQDVPVSVSVVAGDALIGLNVVKPSDVGNLVSGLQTQPGAGPGSTRFSAGSFAIRGQSGATGVVTYLNEVPQFPADAFDIESIQVLKGPQGTLFGNVTTGGAVLLQTKRPTDDVDGYIDVKYSRFDLLDVEAALNVPIAPGVFTARVAAVSHTGGSFTRNLANNGKRDGQDNQTVRLTTKLNLGNFENLTMATYGRSHDQNKLWVPLQALGQNLSGGNLGTSAAIPASVAALNNISCTPTCPTWLSVMRQQLAVQANLGPYKAYNNALGQDPTIEYKGVINTASYRLRDWLTIKDIFSYSVTNTTSPGYQELDGFNLPFQDVYTPAGKGERVYTNEAQVQAEPFKGLNLVGGHFWRQTKRPTFARTIALQTGGVSGGADVGYISMASKSEAENEGIFGQADWQVFSTDLTITAGLRQTRTKTITLSAPNRFSRGPSAVSLTGLPTELITIPGVSSGLILGDVTDIPGATRLIQSGKKTTYTLAALYKVSDDISVYATNRTGYKPGGYAPNAPVGFQTFGPETVTDWEAGVKTKWSLGEMRGTAQLAVYNDDYKDIQISVTVPNTPPLTGSARVVANAAQATIRGFDFDLSAQYGAFEFNGYFSLTDAKYDKYPNTGQFGVASPYSTLDLTQQLLPLVSKYRFGLRPAVHLNELGMSQDVVLSANVYYRSRYTIQQSDILSPVGLQEGRALADLRAEWLDVAGTGGLRLGAGVINVGNFQGLTTVNDSLRANGFAYGSYQQPRTWYVQAHYEF